MSDRMRAVPFGTLLTQSLADFREKKELYCSWWFSTPGVSLTTRMARKGTPRR